MDDWTILAFVFWAVVTEIRMQAVYAHHRKEKAIASEALEGKP